MEGAVPPRATFRDVFAVREFRALWLSEVLSVAGDRLALVALTLLVYHRTHSPLLTALVYAAGYLPWVIGGLFLADVADRRPRAFSGRSLSGIEASSQEDFACRSSRSWRMLLGILARRGHLVPPRSLQIPSGVYGRSIHDRWPPFPAPVSRKIAVPPDIPCRT